MQLSHIKSSQIKSSSSLLGGTSLDFTRDRKTNCIIGTESGHVLKCDLALTQNASILKKSRASETSASSNANLVSFTYSPGHTGPVCWVSASPFNRNRFLSCGSDGQLRLYDILDSKPLQILGPSPKSVFACDWSKSNPDVFACAAGDGNAYIYNGAVVRCANTLTFDK